MGQPPPLPDNSNLPFVEGLYEDYLREPSAVPPEWRNYFEATENGEAKPSRLQPSFRPPTIFNLLRGAAPDSTRYAISPTETLPATALQERVDQLVRAYRVRGHLVAEINPLGFSRPRQPELEPAFYGFSEADLDAYFSCESMHSDAPLKLRHIVQRLRNTYCRSIGVEFMHIVDPAVRKWLEDRMESSENRLLLGREDQVRIFTRLTDAVTFEEFIRKKFVGAKSFSLEGSESLIPLLDLAIREAAQQGTREIVLGMAHRGRLNVLANIMGKHASQIFREFADVDADLYVGRGDVKYHLGHSTDWEVGLGNKIHLSLCFNPSHLEFVNPVVLGRIRAKQDRADDSERARGMAILIHGDAAFPAQGVVQETLNLSQLPAYSVGGTLHIVINNQVGFTTGPEQGRSTTYATDVAKMLQIPIFHVNGEDPEAVAQVVKLSLGFRQTFRRDVVIDIYGYRRLGHNEVDEPAFTQPLLYRAIEKRKSVREGYLEHLLKLEGLTREEAEAIADRRQDVLEKALSESQGQAYSHPSEKLQGVWANYLGGPEPRAGTKTGASLHTGAAVDQTKLANWLLVQTQLPDDFQPHPKIRRFLEARKQMAAGAQPLDWSAAEALALASIASEGWRVRLTGQDTERGTFSQRHAVLHDFQDGKTYTPLQHISPKQAPVEIYNSPLSEVAVLGFEYGYSLDYPDGLTIWEAQFGDFINAAQVIVDQFIASAEDKWRRLSGLVLLLPHGFEGAGPEHSSARLERFLALAAEDNIQVVYPTTPAQYFHCLRRQVIRTWRKPLVIMTPKSLLRHPRAVSSLEDCARGGFREILPDALSRPPAGVRRILLCAGKIYYDLEKHREELKREDVAIVRLEQLYPLAQETLRAELDRYKPGTPAFWVQEEPENMGAWRYLRVQFGEKLFGRFPFSGIYRPASASPATGSASSHKKEQAEIIEAALLTDS